MIAKWGFVLLLALFGGLMFAAGLVAPPAWRQPAASVTQRAMARLDALLGTTPPGAAQAAASDGAARPGAKAGVAPIPAESLLLPAPLPDQGRYALQAGRFANPAQADALGKLAREQGLPVEKALEILDADGTRWWLLPIGPYASPDEARRARAEVGERLDLEAALPVVLLPTPPKA